MAAILKGPPIKPAASPIGLVASYVGVNTVRTAKMTDKTAGKQRGRPFNKGRGGNPAGRPEGSRHKASIMIEALLEGESEAVGRKCIEMAKNGDATALRLVMERIAPLRRRFASTCRPSPALAMS